MYNHLCLGKCRKKYVKRRREKNRKSNGKEYVWWCLARHMKKFVYLNLFANVLIYGDLFPSSFKVNKWAVARSQRWHLTKCFSIKFKYKIHTHRNNSDKGFNLDTRANVCSWLFAGWVFRFFGAVEKEWVTFTDTQ